MCENQQPYSDWVSLLAACKRGEIAACLAVDFAAEMPDQPPVGPITRGVLMVWAEFRGSLRGGTFRFRDDAGFGVSGNRSEPFLSRVCGANRSTQFAALLDLAVHEPSASKAVFERIHALAEKAAEEVPNIGRMAMPAEAKQMHKAMCLYLIGLSETAKAAEDGNPFGVLDSLG